MPRSLLSPFVPLCLLLIALCPVRAWSTPELVSRAEGVSLDPIVIRAERERVRAVFRPVLEKLLGGDDTPLTQTVALYAATGIVRDTALADSLRERRAWTAFPDSVFLNAFIAASTDTDADVEVLLLSLPDTFKGSDALYSLEGRLADNLPLLLVDQAYDAVRRGRFPELAASRLLWGEKYVLSHFLCECGSHYAEQEPRLRDYLKAHPEFYADYEAQAGAAEARPPARLRKRCLIRPPGRWKRRPKQRAWMRQPGPWRRLTPPSGHSSIILTPWWR